MKSDLPSTRPWKMFHAQNCPKIFPTSYIYVLHCHMTLSRQKNCKHIIFWKRNEKKKIMYGCKRHRWDFQLIGSESHWERKFTNIQLDIGLFRAKMINVYWIWLSIDGFENSSLKNEWVPWNWSNPYWQHLWLFTCIARGYRGPDQVTYIREVGCMLNEQKFS